MKYGFSTLVCPGWQWNEILASASDLGFDGIELRGIGSEIYLPKIQLFLNNGIDSVKAELNRLNLQIPCLSTSAFLFDPSLKEAAQLEATEYIALAAKLGVPFIRLLGDRDPAPGPVDEASVIENLQLLLPKAEAAGVTLLIESNGVYADSAKLQSLCEKLAHPSLGVLWDVHHPFRFFGEAPTKTYENLKSFIRHVHIKDSEMSDGTVKYKMLGYGDVPIKEAISNLLSDGYDDFLVFEWVKRWNFELEAPGIVLPHFISAVKDLQSVCN